MIINWLDFIFFSIAIGCYFMGYKAGMKKGKHDAYQEERVYRMEEKIDELVAKT